MKTPLKTLLLVFIGSCPIWCEAMENAVGGRARLVTASHVPHPPVHDDCVCNGICDGAVSHAAPTVAFDWQLSGAPTWLDLLALPVAPSAWEWAVDRGEIRAIDGEPPPDPPAPTQALLQTFRC